MQPGPLRILYVDDDHNDLALFGIAVDQTDLDVWLFTATDGQQAIDYLEGTGDYADRAVSPLPDLILLDLKMALTNGLEFLTWRQLSPFHQIPVILFTSDITEAEKQRALAAGANAYMEKPHGFVDLKNTVAQIWHFAIEHHAVCLNSSEDQAAH